MFKFFALCMMAVVALASAAAKPGVVAPVAYSAYSAPLIASPYAAYGAAYSAPLVASPYIASPYAAAYSAYPYSSLLLRR